MSESDSDFVGLNFDDSLEEETEGRDINIAKELPQDTEPQKIVSQNAEVRKIVPQNTEMPKFVPKKEEIPKLVPKSTEKPKSALLSLVSYASSEASDEEDA